MNFRQIAGSMVSLILTISWHSAHAAPKDGDVFGHWYVVCPSENPKHCVIAQDVIRKSDGARFARMEVGRFLEGTEFSVSLNVPLGLTLARGIAFRVDERASTVLPFVSCSGAGCWTRANLDDGTINFMKMGKAVNISFNTVRGDQKDVRFSLVGFTKAIKSLAYQ